MSSGRWPWPDIAIGLILASLLVGAGLWLDWEVHEARQASQTTRAALVKTVQAERRVAEDCRKFAEWAEQNFTVTCKMSGGAYDGKAKSCSLPGGKVVRYETPFP
jgi:hypothetical protein